MCEKNLRQDENNKSCGSERSTTPLADQLSHTQARWCSPLYDSETDNKSND